MNSAKRLVILINIFSDTLYCLYVFLLDLCAESRSSDALSKLCIKVNHIAVLPQISPYQMYKTDESNPYCTFNRCLNLSTCKPRVKYNSTEEPLSNIMRLMSRAFNETSDN